MDAITCLEKHTTLATLLMVLARELLDSLSVGLRSKGRQNVACCSSTQPPLVPSLACNTQGCNSRVFRATLRPRRRDQQTSSVNGNGAKRKRCQDAPPASMASPSVPAAVLGSGAEGGHSSGTSSSIPPQAGSVADGLVGFGERFLTGSFGSCFTGNYANSRQGGTEAREASRAGRADGRVGTEWAIKMALTLVGQDPIQVLRSHL